MAAYSARSSFSQRKRPFRARWHVAIHLQKPGLFVLYAPAGILSTAKSKIFPKAEPDDMSRLIKIADIIRADSARHSVILSAAQSKDLAAHADSLSKDAPGSYARTLVRPYALFAAIVESTAFFWAQNGTLRKFSPNLKSHCHAG
jgi:hypothetical protein